MKLKNVHFLEILLLLVWTPNQMKVDAARNDELLSLSLFCIETIEINLKYNISNYCNILLTSWLL